MPREEVKLKLFGNKANNFKARVYILRDKKDDKTKNFVRRLLVKGPSVTIRMAWKKYMVGYISDISSTASWLRTFKKSFPNLLPTYRSLQILQQTSKMS